MALVVGSAAAGTGMAGAIKAAITGAYGAGELADDAAVNKFCDALANGIVPYIKTNAVVTGTTNGVQAGASNIALSSGAIT